mgnify:CR=1 FL=1
MIKRKPKPTSDIDKYLSEVQSWETDRVHMEQKSRQTAWRVAGVSLFLACLCVGAVAALVPLKTVEPFVVRVDNTTGVVDVVHTLKGGDTTYNESVNKYFAQIYVRAREGYFREMADVNYKAVGLLSGNTEQQRYFDYFTPKNPQSPLVVYGKYAKVNITIKSASFIKPNVALVRFVKEVVRGPDKPELSHWASTVTFKYVGAPMSDADRAVNPLGYQVTDYRTDPESLTAVERQAYKPPEQACRHWRLSLIWLPKWRRLRLPRAQLSQIEGLNERTTDRLPIGNAAMRCNCRNDTGTWGGGRSHSGRHLQPKKCCALEYLLWGFNAYQI